MILSIMELVDIIIMSVFIGFLFKGVFRKQPPRAADYDPLKEYKEDRYSDLKYSILITAPAIVFHELAHKFTALAFGGQATFFAFYHNDTTLLLGIFALVAKLMNFGFFLIVPGYVQHSGIANPLFLAMVAFAGPFLNLVLWYVPKRMVKDNIIPKVLKKRTDILIYTSKINGFLFIFNMLPIPPFDGFSVFSGIIQYAGQFF